MLSSRLTGMTVRRLARGGGGGASARQSSSSAPVHPGYSGTAPVKENMALEDGTPIFVKRGAIDRVLYGLTGAACLGAVLFNLKTYFDFSLPQGGGAPAE